MPASEDGWTLVQSRKERKTVGNKAKPIVRGQRKWEGTSFRAATRLADVFISRVDR